MFKYKVFPNTIPNLRGHQTVYEVVDYYDGEKASGGPLVAIFYNELAANEYADFKNKQKEALINITSHDKI